jgi:hypothetical protein
MKHILMIFWSIYMSNLALAEHLAQGSFEISMEAGDTSAGFNTFVFAKVFQGDLVGSSQGSMLTIHTDIEGSAAYVALESVEASLNGKLGRFVLQHRGTRDRGVESLFLEIVPDSGSGVFEGASGRMTISIKNGTHFYELIYSLGQST